MNKKFMTPIDKEVQKIMETRTKFALVSVFNELVRDLRITDESIQNMPDGEEKEKLIKSQQEAWALLLSEEMCESIIIEA